MWRDLIYPQYRNWHWAFCFSVGFYVYLFVIVCEPFKDELLTYVWASQTEYYCHAILDFLSATAGCALLIIVLPKFFPKFFSPENLTLPKFILSVIAIILLVEIEHFVTCAYFLKFDLTLERLITYLSKVTFPILIFAIFPFSTAFVMILRSYFQNKKYVSVEHNSEQTVDKSDEPINSIAAEGTPQYKPDLIPVMLKINDNSNKKDLEIPLDSLYYITSDHNYVEVHYQNNSAVNTRRVLRNSLKAIEEDIISNSNLPLIRCHKAFIINTEKVEALHGPSKSAHFILSGIETPIPVSRQKYSEFETRFPNTES